MLNGCGSSHAHWWYLLCATSPLRMEDSATVCVWPQVRWQSFVRSIVALPSGPLTRCSPHPIGGGCRLGVRYRESHWLQRCEKVQPLIVRFYLFLVCHSIHLLPLIWGIFDRFKIDISHTLSFQSLSFYSVYELIQTTETAIAIEIVRGVAKDKQNQQIIPSSSLLLL